MGSKMMRMVVVLLAQAVILTPGQVWACPVCFGAVDSPMARGMNWAIFALLGITGGVLCAFAAFFIYLLKRSRMMLGQEMSLPRSTQPGGGY